MRTLVIICSLAVVCMALPSEEMMSRIAEKTVHKSVQMIRKRDVEKRDVSAGVRLAFSWIDSNKDGHITADEFATFYANYMPQLTREQWRRAFQAILPRFDANNNGTLEIDEFAAIAAAGGAGK